MARGRKKKHIITYDSKETTTLVGLLAVILGTFFLISMFTSTQTDNNIFARVKSAFGDATIFTSIYLIIVGIRLLGVKLPVLKAKTYIVSGFLVLCIAGIYTAFSGDALTLSKLDQTKGGSVGSYIVIDLLGDKFPTQPATKFILIAIAVVIFILALPMSLRDFMKKVNKFINFAGKVINVFFFEQENPGQQQKGSKLDAKSITEKASTFGDFNKIITDRKLKPDLSNEKPQKESLEFHGDLMPKPIIPKMKSETNVDVKEGSIGDTGLSQDELKYPGWQLPPLSLLIPFKKGTTKEAAIDQNARIIEQTLSSFAIQAKVDDAFVGPSVIQYALNIPLGINVKKIANLSENIALALGVDSQAIRIESIPETTYLGIEVPRTQRDLVRFKELMGSNDMIGAKGTLPVPIGKDINGNYLVGTIDKMPHLLIAGATGSGKSVLTNSFITSLIMKKTPDELKLILVDPKQVELMDYNGIPHLLTPVITDMDKVVNALKWAVNEMELRYSILAQNKVRKISEYNENKGFASMPYIVIVIDEMADMMMTANRVEAETAIVRLAQKARAVGIHLILATQRPSVNVITGIIKANIPGRVGMSVTSSTDSRVIMDKIGAESLMGNGDMLYKAPDSPKITRLQGSFIDQSEVIKVVDFIKAQAPEVEYINEITEKHGGDEDDAAVLGDISGDSLIEQAIRIVVQSGKGSSSYLQRRLNIGFNRAARLLEELEDAGVVGPANGSRPREVLISDADEFIRSMKGE